MGEESKKAIMGNQPNDNAAIRIPPPLFFFACLGIGLLLEYLSPIHLASISLIPRVVVGGTFILVSIYFALSGFVVLIKNRTPFDTAKATIKIVQEGPYRFSRNPLYLSLLLLLFGISVLIVSLWLLFTLPILYILFLFKAVKPEENYLSQKFGEEYLAYSSKVRRWI
jgi:protein-S-isoprenylcysteine O-methyltransferase Ste14